MNIDKLEKCISELPYKNQEEIKILTKAIVKWFGVSKNQALEYIFQIGFEEDYAYIHDWRLADISTTVHWMKHKDRYLSISSTDKGLVLCSKWVSTDYFTEQKAAVEAFKQLKSKKITAIKPTESQQKSDKLSKLSKVNYSSRDVQQARVATLLTESVKTNLLLLECLTDRDEVDQYTLCPLCDLVVAASYPKKLSDIENCTNCGHYFLSSDNLVSFDYYNLSRLLSSKVNIVEYEKENTEPLRNKINNVFQTLTNNIVVKAVVYAISETATISVGLGIFFGSLLIPILGVIYLAYLSYIPYFICIGLILIWFSIWFNTFEYIHKKVYKD